MRCIKTHIVAKVAFFYPVWRDPVWKTPRTDGKPGGRPPRETHLITHS
jgi:hypothetical protein